MRRAGRIERADIDRRRQAAPGFENCDIGRRIEPEFGEAPGREFARRDLARRFADIQKPKRGVEMAGKLRWHSPLRSIDRPSARRAMKCNTVRTGADLDTCDVGWRDRNEALGREGHLAAQLGPAAGGRERPEKQHENNGRKRCSPSRSTPPGGIVRQRRLHHITTPKKAVLRGSSTSSAMNVSRICRLVSTTCGRS